MYQRGRETEAQQRERAWEEPPPPSWVYFQKQIQLCEVLEEIRGSNTVGCFGGALAWDSQTRRPQLWSFLGALGQRNSVSEDLRLHGRRELMRLPHLHVNPKRGPRLVCRGTLPTCCHQSFLRKVICGHRDQEEARVRTIEEDKARV